MRASILSVVLCAVAAGTGCKSDSDGGEEMQARGEGVPSSWSDYCTEIGEAYCQREAQCAGDDLEICMSGFVTGCCEADDACGSSFGAGASSEEYEACVDDTNDGACGSSAPESCQRLAAQSPPISGDGPRSLASACSASCLAQDATNCPGLVALQTCIDGCNGVPESRPECEEAWIELNSCMADAPLFCDSVNGGAAVSTDDCGPEIEAFTSCV